MRKCFAYKVKKPFHTGVRTCFRYLIWLYVCLCTAYVKHSLFLLNARAYANPGSMEAGKYGLTRGMCFVARRLEVVAVAGLLWISWCVLGKPDFFVFFRVFLFFFFERIRPAASLSSWGRLMPLGKKALHTGVRTRCHYLISLSVCLCVCVTFMVLLIARAVRGRFPQTRDLWERGSMD